MKQLNVPAEALKILETLEMKANNFGLATKATPDDVMEESQAALLSLIEQVGKEIIGEDDKFRDSESWSDVKSRNQLKAAQRQTLNALLKGEKE